MPTTVELDESGRIALPEEALLALNLSGGTRLDLTVVEGGILLRPEVADPPEDAWAHTPEYIAAIRQSQGQRGYRLGPNDLEKLVAAAEAAHREGREYRVAKELLEEMEAAHGGPFPE